MKKKIIFVLLIVTAFFTIVKYTVNGSNGNLVGPGFVGQIIHTQPTPTPIATPKAPKTFNFNSSTDLKAELEKVNPKVLDSDFE